MHCPLSLSFFYILFLFKRQRDRGTEKDLPFHWFTPLDVCNTQSWARLVPGAWCLVQVFHVGGRDFGQTWLEVPSQDVNPGWDAVVPHVEFTAVPNACLLLEHFEDPMFLGQ